MGSPFSLGECDLPWNGSGTFNRIYSWVADKSAGLDISSSRMDTDTNDLASSGFGNTLTRDGQGAATANLPMNGFRHTNVQNAVSRTDYAAFGQVQDGLPNWTAAGGTADALTATFTPALASLSDGQLCFVRAASANATTTPTFSPNGLTARTITKLGGAALAAGDIAGANAELILRYNLANTRWELLNPATTTIAPGSVGTAAIVNSAVTYAKLQNETASTLLGNPTGGAAAPSEITLGANMSIVAGALVSSTNPALIPGYLSGLTGSTAGGSGTMAIAAGAANDTAHGGIMVLASAISKTTASWAVGSANGGLDTGAIAANTWYHFYEIERPDTGVVDVAFSVSASAPTTGGSIPAAYTLSRRIFSWKTDGSSHWIAATQTADQFIWTSAVIDMNGVTLTASRVSTTLTVPTGIVVNALFRSFLSSSTGAASIFTSLQEADVAPTTGVANAAVGPADLVVSNGNEAGSFARLTNTSAQIGVRSNTTTGILSTYTYGWIDTRGK